MKTVSLMLLVMTIATVYVFDVGGAREPMTQAFLEVRERVTAVADSLRQKVPRAG